MARLFRRSDAEAGRPSRQAPVLDISFANGDLNSREPCARVSAALHSPSSWQRAQKIQSLSPSKRQIAGIVEDSKLTFAAAHSLQSESAPSAAALVPCDVPTTPNAAVRMQRALTPKLLPIQPGNVLPPATYSRPSTAAGSSLPPRNLSSRGVPSSEYFAASEATAMRRSSQHQLHTTSGGQHGTQLNLQHNGVTPTAEKQRQNTAEVTSTAAISHDPVVQLAASVFDASHNSSIGRSSSPALGALVQELSKLQAHRAMEVERLKAAVQHAPPNLLMRQRDLPESQPSEHGKLELSLRNRYDISALTACAASCIYDCRKCFHANKLPSTHCLHNGCDSSLTFDCSTFFNGQGYRAIHANQPVIALKHFAAAFNMSKSSSQSFRNLFALGSLAASSGDLNKAAQFFRAAINSDSQQALAHFALGSVHFLQESYTDALHCYDRAIELNGDIKEFYHNRALVRRRMGL